MKFGGKGLQFPEIMDIINTVYEIVQREKCS